MNDMTKRNILFLIGCMGVRSTIAYTAKRVGEKPELREKWLKTMGYIALIPAIGFMYIYLTDSRKTGPEVFGGEIWWNDLRPVHGCLWLAFAIYAIKLNANAWLFLAGDTLVGLLAFLDRRYAAYNPLQVGVTPSATHSR
jgi:hypothetical protein